MIQMRRKIARPGSHLSSFLFPAVTVSHKVSYPTNLFVPAFITIDLFKKQEDICELNNLSSFFK